MTINSCLIEFVRLSSNHAIDGLWFKDYLSSKLQAYELINPAD